MLRSKSPVYSTRATTAQRQGSDSAAVVATGYQAEHPSAHRRHSEGATPPLQLLHLKFSITFSGSSEAGGGVNPIPGRASGPGLPALAYWPPTSSPPPSPQINALLRATGLTAIQLEQRVRFTDPFVAFNRSCHPNQGKIQMGNLINNIHTC